MESLEIYKLKSLMEREFDSTFIRAIFELHNFKLRKIKELQNERKGKIANWIPHYAGNFFFDELESKMEELGFTTLRKSFRGYKYVEIVTDNFRLFTTSSSEIFGIKDKPILEKYTIRDESSYLFPNMEKKEGKDTRIPLFIVSEKTKDGLDFSVLKIIAKVENVWDEGLCINVLENLSRTNIDEESLVHENLPPAIEKLEFRNLKIRSNNEEA
ncbi:hypothetical protein JWG41_09420 [Leptospira sp. 201903075]|uniref:hypothetical protein n=1 Tax=Leptospira chreensis TaxID=2810035 RepID=UPI001963042E|nr:hypothetical protein [Leptospira chreensis]MBM9590661.1 hypothetical protein [Leptospira chreensis]